MKKRLLALALSCGMLLSACNSGAQNKAVEEYTLYPKLVDNEYIWVFDMTYPNETKAPLRLLSVEVADGADGSDGYEICTGTELVDVGLLEDTEILPGEVLSLYLTTEQLSVVEERTIVLVARNDAYETFSKVYHFDLMETEKFVPTQQNHPEQRPEQQIEQQPGQQLGSQDAIAVYPQGSDWQFISQFMNDTGAPITFRHLEIVDHLNGQVMGSFILSAEELGWHDPNIQPNTEFRFEDWHPVADVFDARDYIFTFVDSNGNTFEKCFRFEVHHEGGGSAPLPEDNGVRIEGEAVYPNDIDSWHFEPAFINDTGSALTLDHIEVIDFMGTQELRNSPIPVQNLPPDFPLTCAAGQEFRFYDNHPYVPEFNGRVYIFLFRDASGKEVVKEFPYALYSANGEGAPNNSVPSGDVNFVEWLPDAQTLYLKESGDWIFPSIFTNDTGSVLTLQHVNILNTMNGNDMEPFILTPDQLPDIQKTLAPGELFTFHDGHPQANHFNGRRYIYTFTDASGKEVVKECRFNLYNGTDPAMAPVDYSTDDGQDLRTLRHNADFAINVAPGVDWVPAAHLGITDSSNRAVHQMLTLSPEEKQAEVNTLYEALQLYQISDFRAADDNVRIPESGINWEHHKPGYYAVLTNEGCCATDSNWLNYILRGDYEEVGYMATSQRDGSGHIFNYIKHEGFYYFIDLTHYRASDYNTAVESGDLGDYYSTDFVLGNIHKAESPEAFAAYMVDMFGDPPGLIFLYTNEDCLAVDSVWENGGINITYGVPKGVDVKVVYDDPGDSLVCSFREPPKHNFNWDSLPHHNFR